MKHGHNLRQSRAMLLLTLAMMGFLIFFGIRVVLPESLVMGIVWILFAVGVATLSIYQYLTGSLLKVRVVKMGKNTAYLRQSRAMLLLTLAMMGFLIFFGIRVVLPESLVMGIVWILFAVGVATLSIYQYLTGSLLKVRVVKMGKNTAYLRQSRAMLLLTLAMMGFLIFFGIRVVLPESLVMGIVWILFAVGVATLSIYQYLTGSLLKVKVVKEETSRTNREPFEQDEGS